jgi:hypothetical protein
MCSQITAVGIDWKTLSFEKSHTFDGYVFATPSEKCWYISLWLRDRPRWLREHPDRCRRIEDVRQEVAPPAPPVESEIDLGAEPAAPNGQTSSRAVRDNGGDEDDVALVDTLAGDRSPPHEPTLPTPVTTTAVENGGAKVAMSEAEGPKTETTPLAAMGRKRARRRGCQLSPERMRIVLDSLRERPNLSRAAAKAGIHRRTLEYWIKRSMAGDAGYDLEWQGVEWRFHEHCESAMQEAYDRFLAPAVDIALGTDMKDENGNPVPQASWKQRGKMIRFLLEWQFPEKWGKHRKIDVPHNTGVLVIGDIPHDNPKKVNNGTAASVKARKWKAGMRMIQKTKA